MMTTESKTMEWFRAELRALDEKVADVAAGDCGVYEAVAVAGVLVRFADMGDSSDSYERSVLDRMVERLAQLADR